MNDDPPKYIQIFEKHSNELEDLQETQYVDIING